MTTDKPHTPHACPAYCAEFIGTFTLVFIGTAVATLSGFLEYGAPSALMISFAFGITLMVLAITLGPISGCHLNPAVTLPMVLAGRLEKRLALGYVLAQLAGAVAASGTLQLLLSKGFVNEPNVYDKLKHGLGANGNPQGMEPLALFGWEVVMTALFVYIIFTVTRREANPVLAPFAIGGFLLVAHLVGAPLGDSSLNPARSFGPALLQGGSALSILWVFVVGPIVGGLLAMWFFQKMHPEKSPA